MNWAHRQGAGPEGHLCDKVHCRGTLLYKSYPQAPDAPSEARDRLGTYDSLAATLSTTKITSGQSSMPPPTREVSVQLSLGRMSGSRDPACADRTLNVANDPGRRHSSAWMR